MMRFIPSVLKSLILLLMVAVSAFSQSSFAATLNLNYTATYNGASIDNTVVNPTLNVPGTFSNYSNFYSSLTNTIPGTGYEFFDDYVFSVGGSSVSSITATVSLSSALDIDNLSVRLFSWNGLNEQLSQTVTLADSALLGSNLMAEATTTMAGSGETATIDATTLASGTYVLQVRGNVTGTAGGGYSGLMNVTAAPVPLPAALPLLMSGMGLLGGLFGRRRVSA